MRLGQCGLTIFWSAARMPCTHADSLREFAAHGRYDFTHRADDRVRSFLGYAVSAVGYQHLASTTGPLRESALQVHPSSQYVGRGRTGTGCVTLGQHDERHLLEPTGRAHQVIARMPGPYLRVGKRDVSLSSETRQNVPLGSAPMLRGWPGIRRHEAHHAESAQDHRDANNHGTRNRRPFAMRHALNRAGILVRGIHEHHAGCLARVGVVIQANDVPAKRMAHEHERRPESCVLHQAM